MTQLLPSWHGHMPIGLKHQHAAAQLKLAAAAMLILQAVRDVAMPQRQWLPYARAVASVTKPQEQCRRDGRSPRKRRRSSRIPNPKSESESKSRWE